MHMVVSAPEPPRQVAKTWPRCTGLRRRNVCTGFGIRCTVLLCRMSSLAVAIAAFRKTTFQQSCARHATSFTGHQIFCSQSFTCRMRERDRTLTRWNPLYSSSLLNSTIEMPFRHVSDRQAWSAIVYQEQGVWARTNFLTIGAR